VAQVTVMESAVGFNLPSGGKQLLYRRKFSAVLREVTAANDGRI
jgi:hypothetical protein